MSIGRVLILGAVLAGLVLTPPVAAGGWDSYDENMAKSWEAIYNTGDAAAVAAFYTMDGARMPPNHPAVKGREAIAAFIKEGMETGLAKVELGTDEVEISGDMGFATGTYVILDPEGNQVDNGKWMQVGKKIDGKWYAYCDIWNSDNPLPE
jgi:uncharacterized protein (TIGR02246 family)